MWTNLILLLLLSFNIHKVLADDCEQFPPEINMNLQQCCSFANITDPKLENKVQTTIKEKASSGINNFEMACSVAHLVFKEMNIMKDNEVDRDLYMKMIDTKISKEVDFWKQPLKNGFEQCKKRILTDATKITEMFSNPPFNIKKENCDTHHLVMLMCLHLDSFVNCPAQAWKVAADESNHKACDNVKSWFGNCGKDLNALKKIVLKSTGMN